MTEPWDFIIVGAGSTGCVLAERLSASGKHRVLVLEAGGENDGFWVGVPKGVAKLVTNPDHIWTYAVSQKRDPASDTQEYWIRGKGLGGSSSVNGMIWSRGEAADYDAWEASGCTGWNGASMTAAFRTLEDHAAGSSDLRGEGGPVHVDPAIHSYPLCDTMIAAGEALGLKRVDDLNGSAGPRVGLYSHNIRRGKRQSAAVTYLAPARKRANVKVVTGALVERIIFEGSRAAGVEVRINGVLQTFQCGGEIIVSAGAMESPLLLQRSGVGDGARLRAAGVAVVVASPDVGERMIEHLAFAMPYRLNCNVGNSSSFYGIGAGLAMARYLITGGGVLATGPFEVGGFCNVAHPDGRTDLQLYLGGYTFEVGDDNDPVPLDKISKQPGITIYGQLLRLTSEGSVRLRGPNAADAPEILPNWLTSAHDRASAVATVRLMRRYMAQAPLASLIAKELIPGAQVESDEDILAAFKRLSTCGLHAIGSCRMGADNRAVVDPQLRVNGVQGLRVADCSIIPGHVTGNTNAPAMAVGLRAAEMILAG